MSEAILKEKKSGGFFSVLQRVGRAFMLPIALLPIAGLLLGIGASFTNTAMLEAYNLMGILGPGTFLNSVFTLLSSVGTVIFDNLPLLFAMGVALGMAENEKATATLSAAIAFFVMHKTINTLLALTGRLAEGAMQEGTIANVVGIPSLQMGVFGGIIVAWELPGSPTDSIRSAYPTSFLSLAEAVSFPLFPPPFIFSLGF